MNPGSGQGPRAWSYHEPYWSAHGLQAASAIAERDIPDIANIERPAILPRLLQLAAALYGQLASTNDIGGRLDIDRRTALRYLALLEQTFAVRTLPSWSNNALKRLVKVPKLPFVDAGRADHLVNFTAKRLYRADQAGRGSR